MKAIANSFEGSGILASQAKVGLQATRLDFQSLKSEDQYECLVKLIETMESASYLLKKRCKQSKNNLTSEKTLAALPLHSKKKAKE